jgi:uncharacterized protein (TIGR02145 family)
VNLLIFTFISLLVGSTVYSQNEVKVGNQIWMKENLKVDRFQNGDSIPEARTASEWVAAGEAEKPAWCYFNNDPSTEITYGRLYNWYAVSDKRGLAPQGWRVANSDDYQSLISCSDSLRRSALAKYNGKTIRPLKIKKGEKPPKQLNIEIGYRKYDGSFSKFYCDPSDCFGLWWTASHDNWRTVTFSGGIVKFSFVSKHNELANFGSLSVANNSFQSGLFVRCIKK